MSTYTRSPPCPTATPVVFADDVRRINSKKVLVERVYYRCCQAFVKTACSDGFGFQYFNIQPPDDLFFTDLALRRYVRLHRSRNRSHTAMPPGRPPLGMWYLACVSEHFLCACRIQRHGPHLLWSPRFFESLKSLVGRRSIRVARYHYRRGSALTLLTAKFPYCLGHVYIATKKARRLRAIFSSVVYEQRGHTAGRVQDHMLHPSSQCESWHLFVVVRTKAVQLGGSLLWNLCGQCLGVTRAPVPRGLRLS